MFRFSTTKDITLMSLGIVSAILMGTGGTISSFLTGDMFDTFKYPS